MAIDVDIDNDNNLVAEMQLDNLGYFNVTPERIRDIVMSHLVISGPGINTKYMPSSKELEVINNMMRHAVTTGQVIDFGHWPNDMIREVGHRGGNLYCQGVLGHPFSTPYVIVHSWSDPKLPVHEYLTARNKDGRLTCAYLVNPFPKDKELCIDFEAMTFEGLVIPKRNGVNCLGVGDRVILDSEASKQAGYYGCQCIPFALRFLPDKDSKDFDEHMDFFVGAEFQKMSSNRNSDDILHSAAGNVLDPIMVALLLLNTKGVSQHVVTFDRLNKARVKANKSPIPPYRRVNSVSYVTSIINRVNSVSVARGGTHASPIMHIRRGHFRHYKSGEKSFIADTLVGVNDPSMRNQFKAQRSHYTMKDNNDSR